MVRPTLNQVLTKLLNMKKIERLGQGRATRYRVDLIVLFRPMKPVRLRDWIILNDLLIVIKPAGGGVASEGHESAAVGVISGPVIFKIYHTP